TRDDLLLLARVRVAAPCSQSWYTMRGDDRVRFCASCKQNVYDLSELDAIEARELLNRREEQICVRLWRRRDGTLITRDCGEGELARLRRRLVGRIVTHALAALAVLVALAGMTTFLFGDDFRRLMGMSSGA